MRTVVFLETSLRVGGTETVVSQLVLGMDPSRFRPVACCMYEPGELGEKLLRAGEPVVHGLGAGRWDPRIGVRLFRLLRKERAAVLFIVNQPLTQFWGTLCGILAGVPVRIMAIRSTGKVNRISRRLLINRLTLPWITRVTALGPTHKAYLMERERIPASKIEIIPNGVNLQRFSADGTGTDLRQRLGLPAAAPLVGIVAMLRPEKNHRLFLEAARQVLAKIPAAHFLIIGDGKERPGLEGWVREAGIGPHVHFLGVREDVPSLVKLLDVAVLSSRPVVETLSNAVLEYMAAARPVVATRVGCLPEQVAEGETGFLVDPNDAEGMAAKITRLLQDESLRQRMGQAGFARVKERYTVERMIRETESLFDRLLEEAGAAR